MRTSDIWQAKQNPSYVKTDKLYVDTDVPVEQMSLEEAKRGMCAAAGNDVLKCESCSAKCKFGRRIVELLKPVEMERTEKKMDRTKAVEAMNAKRKQKSTKAYLSAIASGEPLQWFVDNGYEPKNAMVRLRKNYGDMTQDEAVRRLAEMGILVEEQEDKPDVVVAHDVIEATQDVVKAKPNLRITQLAGEFFTYSLSEDGLSMDGRAGAAYVELSKVSSMCEEIAKVAQLLKNGITL